SKAIYCRADWPAGQTFAVGLAYPVWLTDLLGKLSVDARLPHSSPVSTMQTWGGCALGNDGIREHRRYLEVGDLRPATNEVVFDVEFRTDLSSKKPSWSGTVSLPVRIVEPPGDGLVSVHDPAIDDALREALTA